MTSLFFQSLSTYLKDGCVQSKYSVKKKYAHIISSVEWLKCSDTVYLYIYFLNLYLKFWIKQQQQIIIAEAISKFQVAMCSGITNINCEWVS